MKNQKGITLVALIITIIVMLILVAVSVAFIINSDILGTAKDAGDKYTEKQSDEGSLNWSNVTFEVEGFDANDYISGLN